MVSSNINRNFYFSSTEIPM